MFSIFRFFFFPFFLFHCSPTLHPRCCCFRRLRSEFSLYETWQSSLAVSRSSQDAWMCGREEVRREGKRNFHQWKCFSRSVLCSLFFLSLRLSPSFAYLISYTSPSTHHELEQLSPRPDTRWKRNSRKNKEAEESSGAARERERSRRVRENNNIIKINKNM